MLSVRGDEAIGYGRVEVGEANCEGRTCLTVGLTVTNYVFHEIFVVEVGEFMHRLFTASVVDCETLQS